MGVWRHSNGTRSLTHSLTNSILIKLFIKVRLNSLILPTLLSITFVPSAFYAYVWHILEGTSKAYIFSRRQRSRRWVLYKWKYSKEHWQYHRQEMDLGVDNCCISGRTVHVYFIQWRRCDRQKCERAIAAWRWDFAQRKANNKPKSLSCRKTVLKLLKRRWGVSIVVYHYLDNFAWIL